MIGYVKEQMLLGILASLVTGGFPAQSAEPMGTAFTYQGQLKQGGVPVNCTDESGCGGCDFVFSLWDATTDGTPVGNSQTVRNLNVRNGLFTVVLNESGQFGSDAFNGHARWLEVAVDCGTSGFTTLRPRQAITPTPYALHARGTMTAVNVRDFGAIGDGESHLLSERFSTLEEAQAVYPHATSLSDEIDWATIQSALDSVSARGGTVVLPPGTYRITGSLKIGKGTTLTGHGFTSAYLEDNWAASVILKDIAVRDASYDALLLQGNNAMLLNLQVDGVPGNLGDGILIEGARAVLQNVTVTSQGGVGVRVGGKTNGINVNLWRIYNLIVLNNGSHGLYVHDGDTTDGPNANAGFLMGLDARGNKGDGLCIENAVDNQFIGVHSAQNDGPKSLGIHLRPGANGNSFWMPYVEANTKVIQLQLDAETKENVVFGTRSNTVGDSYVDNGERNLVLGRKSETSLWHLYGNLEMERLRINDDGTVSGQWELRQNSTTRTLEVAAVGTGANPLQVKLVHDGGGAVRLTGADSVGFVPTDAPGSCVGGRLFYTSRTDELCFCNGSQWLRVDGGEICNICGNGIRDGDPLEVCDDGNRNNSDSCPDGGRGSCEPAVCGDGFVWYTDGGTEECDDGNTEWNDGCNEACQNEICGDGVIQDGIGEACDDGNTDPGDGCDENCQID